MPIADALRGITGQIERHQGRMTDLASKRMDIEFRNQQLDRQERNDEFNNQLKQAQLDEINRVKGVREAKDNAPFSMRIGKTNNVAEATFQADRIMDGNAALSAALGYGTHYDPVSGNVLRDDTGQVLPNKIVQPHMKAIQAVTVLNASPRRMLEDKLAQDNLPESKKKVFQAQLDQYKKDPIGMTKRELINKQKQFAALAPYLEKNPVLLKQAERGILQTQKDLDSLVSGESVLAKEGRQEARDIAKDKRRLLTEKAKESRVRKTKQEDFVSQEGYKSDLKEISALRKMKVTGFQVDEYGEKIAIDEKNMKDIDARIKVLEEKRRVFEGGKSRKMPDEMFSAHGNKKLSDPLGIRK